MPGMPSTPSAVATGARRASSFRGRVRSETTGGAGWKLQGGLLSKLLPRIRLERVANIRAKSGDIGNIARGEGQPVHLGRRRKQRIDYGYRPRGAHAAPFVADQRIDRQDAIRKRSSDRDQPSFKRVGSRRVVRPRALDAFADFAQYQDAEINAPIVHRSIPARDVTIAAIALGHLGNDIRIDQIVHSSRSRPRSRARLRSIPSSGADASSALRPSGFAGPKGSRNTG